ncbi:MAG TPA: NAD(P)-binding protein [Vicinamibacterales bacterium]
MPDPKTILILGGGVGGIVTARALRRRLPRAHRIVLVDRTREHAVR